MRNPWVRAIVGFVWGLALFLAIAYAVKYAIGSHTTRAQADASQGPFPKLAWSDPVVVSQVVLKTALILIALIAWKMLGRPLSEMGWRKPEWRNSAHLIWCGVAVVTMMATSVVMVLLKVQHPIASQFTFLQLVVAIWLLSSFSEEIYVRGLVQSWVANHDDPNVINSAFTPAIGSSALLFAAMHVPLIWSPAGLTGGLSISIAMLFVGWACAALRARSRSLWSAIACHVMGNVAGLPGSILGIVLYRLIYGDFPDFVKAAMGR